MNTNTLWSYYDRLPNPWRFIWALILTSPVWLFHAMAVITHDYRIMCGSLLIIPILYSRLKYMS